MVDQQILRARELAKGAGKLENNLGTCGGVILAGMLIHEGLIALADAIRESGGEKELAEIASAIRTSG